MAKKKLYNNAGGIVYSTATNFGLRPEAEAHDPPPAKEQLIKIKLDNRHRRGKVVTLIEGFSMSQKGLEELAGQLKALCGTGGTAKDNEIIIQGDHREKVWLWMVKNGFKKAKKL